MKYIKDSFNENKKFSDSDLSVQQIQNRLEGKNKTCKVKIDYWTQKNKTVYVRFYKNDRMEDSAWIDITCFTNPIKIDSLKIVKNNTSDVLKNQLTTLSKLKLELKDFIKDGDEWTNIRNKITSLREEMKTFTDPTYAIFYKNVLIKDEMNSRELIEFKSSTAKMKSLINSSRANKSDVLEITYHSDKLQKTIVLIGGVHNKPNSFTLNFSNKRAIIENKKLPKTDKNYVGIELEMAAPWNREIFRYEFIRAGLFRQVHIGYDSSVKKTNELTEQVEVRILDTQDNINSTIDKVCNALKNLNAESNSSCGVHIHLDMRNRNHKKCFKNLVSCQDLLFDLVDKSRKNNTYCKRQQTNDFDDAPDYYECDDDGHYMAINSEAYHKYETIEVRLHHGTLEPEPLKKWVKLLLSIVEGDEIEKPIKKLSNAKETFKINDDLIEYYKKVKSLNGNILKDIA